MATSHLTTLSQEDLMVTYQVSYILFPFLELRVSGVKTPLDCQRICQFTTDCTNFTWQEGNYCYLVNTPYWLEYDNDKISGDRDCVAYAPPSNNRNGPK